MHIAASSVETFSEGGLFTKDETPQKEVFSPPISTRCDIFSFGVLCLRLMIGEEGPERQKTIAMMLLNYYQSQKLVEGKWAPGNHALLISKSLVQDKLKVH